QAIQPGKVVMGIAGLEYRDRRYPFPPAVAPTRVSSMRELPLRRFDGHLQSRAEINKAADGRGLISSDAKQIVRRVPLVTRIGLLDFQTTALGERIPGVEIHAQILEQIFDGAYLHRPTGATWIEAALLALAGLILVFGVPALRPWMSASLLLALVTLLVA